MAPVTLLRKDTGSGGQSAAKPRPPRESADVAETTARAGARVSGAARDTRALQSGRTTCCDECGGEERAASSSSSAPLLGDVRSLSGDERVAVTWLALLNGARGRPTRVRRQYQLSPGVSCFSSACGSTFGFAFHVRKDEVWLSTSMSLISVCSRFR